MKIAIDMNLSPTWAEYLQAAGLEAQHWSTLGDSREPDKLRVRVLPIVPGIKR